MRLRMHALPLLALSLLTAASTGCALSGGALPQPRSNTANLDRTLSLARLSERHGKLQEAAQIYQSILKSNPDHPVALHRLGVISARSGDYKQALSYFDQARRRSPGSSELLADIGYTQYVLDDLKAAESSLRSALQLDPHNKKARNNLGLVLGEEGRDEESFAEFRKAGDESAAHLNVAYLKSQLGELGEAERHFHRSLELDSNQRPAAEALIQLAEHREAYRRALASRGRGAQPGPRTVPADPRDVIIEDGASRPAVAVQPAVQPAEKPATVSPAARAAYAARQAQLPHWVTGPPAVQQPMPGPLPTERPVQPVQHVSANLMRERSVEGPLPSQRVAQALPRSAEVPTQSAGADTAVHWGDGPAAQPQRVEPRLPDQNEFRPARWVKSPPAPQQVESSLAERNVAQPSRWVEGPPPQPQQMESRSSERNEPQPSRWVSGPPPQPQPVRSDSTGKSEGTRRAAPELPDFLVPQPVAVRRHGSKAILRAVPDYVPRPDFLGSDEEAEAEVLDDRLPPLEPLR